MISLSQGKKLIKLARDAILSAFSDNEFAVSESIKKEFPDVLGVFVTLNIDGNLRGCIGFSEGYYPLFEGVVKAANSAAFSDPRFPPLGKEEFSKVSIEVSVLTKPEKVSVKRAEDYIKAVKVGRDGLIVSSGFGKGLLLPQVATEYNWDSKEFLDQTCVKAGLPPQSWQNLSEIEVYRFQSQVFSEIKPKGEVKQLM